MSDYRPEPASPKTLEELRSYVEQELNSISRAFNLCLPSEIEFLNVVPTKLREGLTVGADGTNWNPGSGQGVYTYYGGAWHKLG